MGAQDLTDGESGLIVGEQELHLDQNGNYDIENFE